MKRFLTKQTLVSSVLALLLLIAIALLVKDKIGELRPALFPSTKNLAKEIEKQEIGEAVALPLKMPSDFKIGVFAKIDGNARDLQFSPGGTLLVSVPNQGKVFALPDKNNDGKADEVKTLLRDLVYPHGLAFYKNQLFVAQQTQLIRYSWDENSLSATKEKVLFTYPKGGGHITRSLAITKEGKLFVSLGSTCNVCFEEESFLAAVIISDVEGATPRVFAKGLRNSVFVKINPTSGELWGAEMGRDLIGDDVPPEEINIIREDGDYGWPICYDEGTHDDSFDPGNKYSCEGKTSPIWKMQAHSAPLGLSFINSAQFPTDWNGDLLVSFHGSWNRSVPTGYKIVHLKVRGNKIVGQEDFLTGFIQGAEALGRPVDLEFDSSGSLYISDDKAGAVYKLVKN